MQTMIENFPFPGWSAQVLHKKECRYLPWADRCYQHRRKEHKYHFQQQLYQSQRAPPHKDCGADRRLDLFPFIIIDSECTGRFGSPLLVQLPEVCIRKLLYCCPHLRRSGA